MSNKFEKKKDYLVCVDSDGCVIDGMTVKHVKCFGPCMIEEWELQDHEAELLGYWNDINLYSMTRGINRFKGLLAALEEIEKRGYISMDINPLRNWIDSTSELSNRSLKYEISSHPSIVLSKALAWSEKVNVRISMLSDDEKKAFEGVKECFEKLKNNAELAVVSSANAKAVEDEWRYNGLLGYTDIVMTQEYGSKAECLRLMIGKGYDPEHILMVGDSLGDISSAESTGVLYYPIQVNNETKSWNALEHEILNQFFDGTYKENGMLEQKEAFKRNLMGKDI